MFSSILGKFIDAHVPLCNFENLPKISCAPHSQTYSTLNYLLYFCTSMLFYVSFNTTYSLVDSWNLIMNFPFFHFFFLQKIFVSDFVSVESFLFYLSLPPSSVHFTNNVITVRILLIFSNFPEPHDEFFSNNFSNASLSKFHAWLIKFIFSLLMIDIEFLYKWFLKYAIPLQVIDKIDNDFAEDW